MWDEYTRALPTTHRRLIMNNAASAVAEIRTHQFWSRFPLPHNQDKTFTPVESLAMASFIQNFVAAGRWVCTMPAQIQEGVTPGWTNTSFLDELIVSGFARWDQKTRTMTFEGPLCVTSLIRLALTRPPSAAEPNPTRLEDNQIVIYWIHPPPPFPLGRHKAVFVFYIEKFKVMWR